MAMRGREEGFPFPGGVRGATPGGSGKAADFTTPKSAVQAFLDALKERDPDLLAESTALRAATESSTRNRDLFTAILDGSLSDDTFDDLIEKLDGFRIVGNNAPKSSGRLGIILEKTEDGDRFRRTIDVRREKAGWKVVDIGGLADLKSSVSGYRSKPRQKNR